MNRLSLLELNSSFAEVLAATVLQMFPSASLVSGEGTSLGFYYDFILPHALGKEQLPIIQEHMQRMVSKGLIIKILDMAPISAAGLLRSHRQKLRADCVAACADSLVQMVQIGDFVDFCEGELLVEIPQGIAFKLVAVSQRGEGEVRILGMAHFDRAELKDSLKDKARFESQDYEQLGEELDLFTVTDEGWFWHPRGEVLKEILLGFWRQQMREHKMSVVSTPRLEDEQDFFEAHQHYARLGGGVAECSFLGDAWIDQAHLFCSQGQLLKESISSLQFMIKISKILGFEARIVLSANQAAQRKLLTQALQACQVDAFEQRRSQDGFSGVDLQVMDALGRWLPAAYLRLREAPFAVEFSLFGSLERTVALLLEKDQGILPLWLVPEQIRVFAVGSEEEEVAQQVCQTLRAAGFRANLCCKEAKLGQRMHQVLREKVPFSIVIGNRERASETVNVRAYGSTEEKRMKIATFIQDYLENK